MLGFQAQWLVAQCLGLAPDGSVMLQLSTRWWHNASIEHKMVAQFFD
jgi:hypothetical protein